MATDFFLKMKDIKGESLDSKHKDELELTSWSFGGSQMGGAHRIGGAGTGRADLQDFHFTKNIDTASKSLFQFLCEGTPQTEITFTARKAGKGKDPLEYLKFTMYDAIISMYSIGGGELPTESVSLNFAKLKYVYQGQSSTGGKEGGEMEFTYSIEKHEF